MLDAPMFAAVTVDAFNVPVVNPEEINALAVVIPVAATIAPDKLKLPPVTVEATIVPTVMLDAPMFAAVTVDAFNVPVVIPVAATMAPDKLKLPPVTVLATTVAAVTVLAAILAAVTVDAFNVPVVNPDEIIPLPTTCKLVLAVVVPIPTFPDV